MTATGPNSVSRRAVMAGTGALLVTALPNRADSQASGISKSAAGYQDSPNNGQSCGACMHFAPPSACTVVDGPVSPQGWCKFFARKG
jgi:hypothetical protein